MAPIILAIILLGLADKTNARPQNEKRGLPDEEEDSYFEAKYGLTLAEVLGSTCDSEPGMSVRRTTSVEFFLHRVICPALDAGGGSGEDGLEEGSGDYTDATSIDEKWVYNFEAVEIFSSDRGVQIALSKIAEGVCRAADEIGFDDSDLERFCRFSRERNVFEDGEESGSGEIFSGSGEDNDNDDDEDDVGFSIQWSSFYDGLENDAFYF